MSNLYELKNDFGVELRDAIIKAFSDYDINVEWKSAWNSPDNSDSVLVSEAFHDIEIYFITKKESFDGLEDSDYPILEKFVRDVVNIFMNKHSKTCDELKLTGIEEVEVGKWDWDSNWVEVFVQLNYD